MSINQINLDDRITHTQPIPYTIFTFPQKIFITILVSIAATFSGFASNIYFPSIPTISSDLSVSTELINLTVTSYMIFQGFSPTLWGAFADVRGRRITYICTFLIFLGACIGLAQTRHYYQLVILRCLQSTGSASTVAIGAGVLGDITTREERGGYMGFFQAGLLFPLAAGPILGGIFSETIGWRAIFWFLAIYSGIFLVTLILFLPETLRSLVGNGSVPAKGVAKFPLTYIQRHRGRRTTSSASQSLPGPLPNQTLRLDFLGPLRILFGGEVTWIILFLSVYYTVWQMTITAMSTLLKRAYLLSDVHVGLTFIANGFGSIIGTICTGKFLDFDYRRIKDHYTGRPENFPIEWARLRTVWLWGALQCASTIVFGWTLNKKVHLSVPLICIFFLGWASTSTQSVITTFLVDVFPKQGASATAALNLSRCLLGAAGTAAVLPIADAIGVGWAFSVFTSVMLASLVLVFVQIQYGAGRRRKREESEGNC